MILISHRGNLHGKQPERENTVQYINEALDKGFDVEIDLWGKDNFLYLGHDGPVDLIDPVYLKNPSLWCHAKNLEAVVQLQYLTKKGGYNIHYFWHQRDDVTLTSKNYIWAFPGNQPIKNSIAVMPETSNDKLTDCIGICSDFIAQYK
ncbi:MAG TPA: hypothetical protein DEG69_20080 [Flavobacteriaceae bacterium]|jgi:hypothetical protein|nr:hypothetical protein [Flavobacteriaceae bacterium]|tara:strand:+ start:156 stop:599 length:444 start_codon:yes stop_codon:yes gene_type:complete